MPDAIQTLIADIEASKLSQNQQPIIAPVDDFVAALQEIETAIGGGIVPSTIVLPNTQILIGQLTGVAAAKSMSGDGTLANTGAITITKSGGVAFGSAAFSSTAAFDAAGAAAAAVVTAEAYTDTKLAGASGTVAAAALILPNGKTFKGDASNQGTTVDAAVPINIVLDGGGAAIASGAHVYYHCEFDGTITGVVTLADQTGSVALGIQKCTQAQFDAGATHPVVGDSIVASAPPSITTSTKNITSDLTGWTVNFSAGDVFSFLATGAATNITRVTLGLKTLRR